MLIVINVDLTRSVGSILQVLLNHQLVQRHRADALKMLIGSRHLQHRFFYFHNTFGVIPVSERLLLSDVKIVSRIK